MGKFHHFAPSFLNRKWSRFVWSWPLILKPFCELGPALCTGMWHQWVIFIEASSQKKKTISIEILMLIHYLKEKSLHKWCDSWVSSRVIKDGLKDCTTHLGLPLYYALHLHYVETAIPNLWNVDTGFNRHFTQAQIAFPYMMNPSLVPRIGERPSNLFKLYTDMTSRKLQLHPYKPWILDDTCDIWT